MSKYTNDLLLNSLNIPVINDIYEFSNIIGVSTKLLYNLSSYQERYYHNFIIEKRCGAKRTIDSPNKSMKLVQKWILVEILEKIKVSDQAMAFVKGDTKGIKENAEMHKYSNYFLELDLCDFFISIKREKVFYIFRKIGYNVLISNMLANICTLNNSLPQGGVCSPYLSNLICIDLDKRLFNLSSKRDIIYTRYADDMTFSCNNEKNIFIIKNIINKIIGDEGFSVNDKKTRLLFPTSNKVVTGITIYNNDVKVKKQYKRIIRAMIYNTIWLVNYENEEKILGMIGFVEYIEPGYQKKIELYTSKLISEGYLKYFKDIVEGFNSSKLTFRRLHMEQQSINNLCSDGFIGSSGEELSEIVNELIDKRSSISSIMDNNYHSQLLFDNDSFSGDKQ